MAIPWKTKPTGRDLSLASQCVRVAYPVRGGRPGAGEQALFYMLAAGLRQEARGFDEEQLACLRRAFASDWGIAVETDEKARLARDCWNAIRAHL